MTKNVIFSANHYTIYNNTYKYFRQCLNLKTLYLLFLIENWPNNYVRLNNIYVIFMCAKSHKKMLKITIQKQTIISDCWPECFQNAFICSNAKANSSSPDPCYARKHSDCIPLNVHTKTFKTEKLFRKMNSMQVAKYLEFDKPFFSKFI